MEKKRNIIVGQSGGPTSVINSSLAGVYKTAKERGFHKVYGMLHGIQGFLDEQYVDLSTLEAHTVGISGFLPLQAAGDPRKSGNIREDLSDTG